jgi:hypothetical protein
MFRPYMAITCFILYNVRGSWAVLTTSCTCYATEDTVRIVNWFITIPIRRNYIHSQLFITLCHIYTAYNHTRSCLQSLITLLHWLTSQLSITVSNYHRLYIFTLRNSRRELAPRIHFLRLLLNNWLVGLLLTNSLVELLLKNWLLKADFVSPMAFRITPLNGHRRKRSLLLC